MRKRKEYLDERQQIERGKAFRNAFFTMAIALLICCTINSLLTERIFNDSEIMMITIWLSLSVYYTTVIIRDALFINNKENYSGLWMTLAICYLTVGIAELWLFVSFMQIQTSDEVGLLGKLFEKAVLGVSMIEVGVVYFVKRIRDRSKAKAAEEPEKIAE